MFLIKICGRNMKYAGYVLIRKYEFNAFIYHKILIK